jgi:hypothetical protein
VVGKGRLEEDGHWKKWLPRGNGGRCWTLRGRSLGLGSQPYVLFISGSFIEDSHVYIVSVFLNITAVFTVVEAWT